MASKLSQTARRCALDILDAGANHKSWTPETKAQWTKAFNALQRLAGKKLILRGGKLEKGK